MPLKALKVSTRSSARWVVDAQAALQRGTASARADLGESVVQEEATEAAMKQAEDEAPRTSEAEVAEARAPGTTEAEVVEASVAEPVA